MHRRGDAELSYARATKQLSQSRMEYKKGTLSEDMVSPNPFEQMERWLEAAKQCPAVVEPTACTLATSSQNKPTTRVVLVKGIQDEKLVFYTNFNSRKGKDIAANPHVSMTFYWAPLERQMHVRGIAEQLDEASSTAYFNTRPLDSRIGAIVSQQSQEIESRTALEENVQRYKDSLGSKSPERPSYWGGYRVVPETFEFWQGRENRLHDRLVYTRDTSKDTQGWKLTRLAP